MIKTDRDIFRLLLCPAVSPSSTRHSTILIHFQQRNHYYSLWPATRPHSAYQPRKLIILYCSTYGASAFITVVCSGSVAKRCVAPSTTTSSCLAITLANSWASATGIVSSSVPWMVRTLERLHTGETVKTMAKKRYKYKHEKGGQE